LRDPEVVGSERKGVAVSLTELPAIEGTTVNKDCRRRRGSLSIDSPLPTFL